MRPLWRWGLPHGKRVASQAFLAEAAETGIGVAGLAVDVGARGSATDHATLEAVRPDARRAGVPGYGMAACGGAWLSCWLSGGDQFLRL